MPYFVKIGAIKQSKSGAGSRGYHLFHHDKYVIARWGAVQVAPGRRFSWCYKPLEKTYKYRTGHDAHEAIIILTKRRTEKEGYSRLPAGTKIH